MANVYHHSLDESWARSRFPQLEDVTPLVEADASRPENAVAGWFNFSALDFETGEGVILRVHRDEVEPTHKGRLLLELEKRAQLRHPRISHVLDHGEIEDYVYVIEACPAGKSLAEAIQDASVSRKEVLSFLPSLMEPIQYAAQQGVTLLAESDTVWIDSSGEIMLAGLGAGNARSKETAMRWIEEHPAIGRRIGNYVIEEMIGEGGFAEVYRTHQEHPIRREVALKILKLGMDTRQVLARFARERQALSQMNHSGIATIFDAGATEMGRPYIVMELVNGEPISVYCDSRSLTLNQRAELLSRVCRAVEHGHSKGVIHRDLKPSNVLVAEEDGKSSPKVIDFGIAKAVEEPVAEHTFFTRTQSIIGSPSYMSPEQLEGNKDVDVRSDVYSLGCLLYELIAGASPITDSDLAEKSLKDVIHEIQMRPIEHPADRVGSQSPELQEEVAARRRCEPKQLLKLLTGRGLSDIALKALAKNPELRYQTAAALAEDLEAWGQGKPVGAPHKWRRIIAHAVTGLAVLTILVLLAIAVSAIKWPQPSAAGDSRLAAAETTLDLSRKPAVSRSEEGTIRPVALFQFEDGLQSAIPGGPDMLATGNPELRYETTEISGAEARVLHFPRFKPTEWLKVPNVIGINGPPDATETNRWTLVYDVMFPTIAGNIALFQCHSENVGESEMYISPRGIVGRFITSYGFVREGEWNRIVIVSSDNGRAQTYTIYLNGTRWGIPWVKGMHSAGYAFDDEFLILCDGDQDTAEGYLNSFAIYDVPLTDTEVLALGTPTAEGIPAELLPGPIVVETGGLAATERKSLDAATVGEGFGSAIAMRSGEAWVAALYSDVAAPNSGAIHRYRLDSESAWQYAGRAQFPNDLNGNGQFGRALAMNDEVAAVGAPRVHGGGALYLYRIDGNDWHAPVRLLPEENDEVALASLGYSVAIAGGMIVTGAPNEDEDPSATEAVVVFDQHSGDVTATIVATPSTRGRRFGAAVAAAGTTIAVGSPGSEDVPSGPVEIFQQDAQYEWRPVARLDPEGGQSSFGEVLAFCPNGERLAVRAGEGTVHIYLRSDLENWKREIELAAPYSEGDATVRKGFGRALAFASPSRLIIGSPEGRWDGVRSGVAFVFDRMGDHWKLVRTTFPAEGTQEGKFGSACVAMGDQAWIGSPSDHSNLVGAGAAYPIALPAFEDQKFATAAPYIDSGSDVAIAGDVAVVGTPGVDERVRGDSIQVFKLESDVWRALPSLRDPMETVPAYSFRKVAVGGGFVAAISGLTNRGFLELSTGDWLVQETRAMISTIAADEHHMLTTYSPFGMEVVPLTLGQDQLKPVPVKWEAERSGRITCAALHGGIALLKSDSYPAVYGFQILHAEWQPQFTLEAPDQLPLGAKFASVGESIDHDGSRAIIGTPTIDRDGNGSGTGAAFVYDLGEPGAQPRMLACPEPSEMPSNGWSVAIRGDVALVGNPTVGRGGAPGRVYFYRRNPSNDTWKHATTLQASNAEQGDEFGISLALDNGWAIIGAKSSWVYFFRVE